MTRKKARQKAKSAPGDEVGAVAPDIPEPDVGAAEGPKGGEGKAPAWPIVGIGTSAGGLAALEAFFGSMPADSEPGIALVLVQHLDPDHKSILRELVSKCTRMKVEEVTDGTEVEPNRVYIIPPNRDMALLRGRLHLLSPVAPRGLRLPIDYFFRSLAQDHQERAIAIVLSGTGTDGTLGLKAVKEAGGMAMVQAPETAAYNGMPRSAIATGLVDFVLPPEKMPEQLTAYVRRVFGAPEQAVVKPAAAQKAGDALQKIFVLLRQQTGHDFSLYKQNTIRRRIERRMAVQQIESPDLYVRYLQQNPVETATLFRELLIGVTSFFRDAEAFEALRGEAIAPLLARKAPGEPVRVWVPGCSSGEEAYSVAILLREHAHEMDRDYRIQVFATDIDHEAIEQARAGIYPSNIAADVSPERLARCFDQENGSYRVKKSVRDLLVFAEQSVIEDPPFSKVDLISCRNLLIYMEAELQRKVLPLFHYALNEGGYLFLGSAETAGESGELFAVVNRTWKIFQRKGPLAVRKAVIEFPPLARVTETGRRHGLAAGGEEKTDTREVVQRALLQRHTPACVLVTESGEVLYIHGRVGKYLEPARGEASLNILRMAREGLRMELTNALRKVVAQKESVAYRGLQVKEDGEAHGVDLLVEPLTEPASARELILVAFNETPTAGDREAPAGSATEGADRASRIAALERELQGKEEYLQTTIEELETSNEELKSANEELQSTNEEIQSTNEELETSKEELQSVNEELMTVNAELQQKIEELSRANSDINNLLAGTGVSTVVVDGGLRIQRFTPSAAEILNLMQHDAGRPLGQFVSNLPGYDGLEEDTRAVLETLSVREAEVRSKDGRWYLLRILPYRTVENEIEGAVLTFIEVTRQKQIQEQLRVLKEEARELASSVVDTVPQPLVVLGGELRVISANRAFYEAMGLTAKATVGRRVYEVGKRQWDIPELRRLLEEILPRRTSFKGFAVKLKTKGGRRRDVLLNAREVLREAGRERLILLAMEEARAAAGEAGSKVGRRPSRRAGRAH